MPSVGLGFVVSSAFAILKNRGKAMILIRPSTLILFALGFLCAGSGLASAQYVTQTPTGTTPPLPSSKDITSPYGYGSGSGSTSTTTSKNTTKTTKTSGTPTLPKPTNTKGSNK